MDTDTYSRKEVVDFVLPRYVAVEVDCQASEGFLRKHDVFASPAQAIFTPDGELMGRKTGYVGPVEYLEWMQAVDANYPKIPPLLAKIDQDPEDFVATADLALTMLRCGLSLPARSHLRWVIAKVTLKKEPTEEERLRVTQCSVALMDNLLHSFYGDKLTPDYMLRTCATARQTDPENKTGLLDDIDAFEVFTYASAAQFDKAIEAGRASLRRFPDGNRADMLRYGLALSLVRRGREQQNAELIKEGRETLDRLLDAHKLQRYAEHALRLKEAMADLEKKDQR